MSQKSQNDLADQLTINAWGYGCSNGRALFIDNGVCCFTGLSKKRIIFANWIHAREEFQFNNLEPISKNPFKKNIAYLLRAFSIGVSRKDFFAGLFNGYTIRWDIPAGSSFINIRSKSNTDVLVSRSAAISGVYTADFSQESERSIRRRSSAEADYILSAKLCKRKLDHGTESILDLQKFATSNFISINPLSQGNSVYGRNCLENSIYFHVNTLVHAKRVIVTHLGNTLNTEKQIIDCDACLATQNVASKFKSSISSCRNHLLTSGKGLLFVNDPSSFIRLSSNWAHFIEDNLPAFHKLVSQYPKRQVHVQGGIAPTQQELLRTLFPGVRITQMREGYSYFFEDVIFVVHRDSRNEAIQGLGSPWPIIDYEGMLSIRSLIASLFPSKPTETRRLFISRRQQGFRKLVNLMEIEKLLVSLGFTIIYPELFTLNERVAIFRSADLIIGESGAGMVNCYFAPDQIPIIELRHPGNSKSVEHLGLISVTQQKYVIIEGRTANLVGKLKHGTDAYTVDQLKVIDELSSLGFK